MKYKAKYGAEADIPDDVKAFYKLIKGEWVFDWEEFEGLDAVTNPSLAANRDTILEEKKNMATAKKAAEDRVSELEGEVNKLKKPGTVIMTADDQKVLDNYKELGTVDDIKAKLENEATLTTKLSVVETKDELRSLAKQLKLNEDALIDFKLNSERGKDVKLRVGKKKVKDKDNKEVEHDALMVVVTDSVNGKDKETEKDFNDYAKEKNYPAYLVNAIFDSGEETKKSDTKKTSFYVPKTTKESTKTADSQTSLAKTLSEKYNKDRSTRKLPWSTKQES